MKNSTLVFRSLLVIVFIAGGAHLVTYASQNTPQSLKPYDETTHDTSTTESEDNELSNQNTVNYETDYIIGKWMVTYNKKEFNGAIVYDIKKEANKFNAYTFAYQDAQGNSEKASKVKTLTITSFDGYQGKGVYKIDYEGETYEVYCQIDMLDENTFKLSYEYYGYSDVETWKKLKS